MTLDDFFGVGQGGAGVLRGHIGRHVGRERQPGDRVVKRSDRQAIGKIASPGEHAAGLAQATALRPLLNCEAHRQRTGRRQLVTGPAHQKTAVDVEPLGGFRVESDGVAKVMVDRFRALGSGVRIPATPVALLQHAGLAHGFVAFRAVFKAHAGEIRNRPSDPFVDSLAGFLRHVDLAG